ncbi:MAG: M23 family metallopeptidase [Gemmatimonadetes bacterium]|nr:M23 family metallopeptidase [Gemmatimonadota bacterium]
MSPSLALTCARVAAVLLCTGAMAASSALQAQQVRFNVDGPLYHHVVNDRRGYEDVLVPAVVVSNARADALVIEGITVEALDGARVLCTIHLDPRAERAATAELSEMRAMGLGTLVEKGLAPGVLGAGTRLATGDSLLPGAVAIGAPTYLTVGGSPTSVRARVDLRGADGASFTVWSPPLTLVAPPAAHLAFPLRGTWYVASLPGASSHHRFNPQTEFAIDMWKLDSAGSIFTRDASAPGDFHGFGLPVGAADAGEVVAAENTATQDWSARRQREGETREAFARRMTRLHMEGMASDPYKALLGNYVVVRHANGLHTMYAHLKQGSVVVRPGQRVARGEHLGDVGDTGDSPLAHLHFQLTDGPDPLRARTIPFVFDDVRLDALDAGAFARPAPRSPSR